MFEQVFKNIDDILYKDPGADSDLIPRLERRSYAKIHLNSYDSEQQEFLNFVLDQYVKKGVAELSDDKLKPLIELKYNTIADAKKVIDSEKDKAMNDVKNTLAELSIDIAEKIIKKDLSKDSSQKKYVEDLIKEINKTK